MKWFKYSDIILKTSLKRITSREKKKKVRKAHENLTNK